MGNNEDWKNPLTYYWVKPANVGEYGILYFGYDDFGPQGGVNEKGLAFDGNALPYIRIKSHPDRLQPSEAIVNYIIMRKCATVEEAIKMASDYDWGKIYSEKFAGQYMIADSTGDAAVIGFGSDGELVITRKPSGDGYIVSTNFNRAYPQNRYGTYPCKRYNTAFSMLDRINKGNDINVDYLTSVLNAVHEEGRRINTLYSNIYDLKKGVVYLYYWHNYTYAYKLKVAEIIKSNQPPKRIKDVFSKQITEKASNEYQYYQNLPLWISLIIVWLLLVFGSEVLIFRKIFRHNIITSNKRMIWILVILLTGPLGLLLILKKTKSVK